MLDKCALCGEPLDKWQWAWACVNWCEGEEETHADFDFDIPAHVDCLHDLAEGVYAERKHS